MKLDLQTMKQVLLQISQQCQTQPNMNSLVKVAIGQFRKIEDNSARLDQLNEQWKEQFKSKVKKRLRSYKSEQRQKLQKVEDSKFKQLKNEFELNERVTQLEAAYQLQQVEINKQANANEELKYQKMYLVQQHNKRMAKIEYALTKIQIQKSPPKDESEPLKDQTKQQISQKEREVFQYKPSSSAQMGRSFKHGLSSLEKKHSLLVNGQQ